MSNSWESNSNFLWVSSASGHELIKNFSPYCKQVKVCSVCGRGFEAVPSNSTRIIGTRLLSQLCGGELMQNVQEDACAVIGAVCNRLDTALD